VGIDDGVITVAFVDKVGRYRNHRADQILQVAQVGEQVRVFEGYGLLGVAIDHFVSQSFCIADADKPWRLCSIAPLISATPESLAERLESRGGFTVPGELLKDWSK
jgi:hypothetical protein